MRLTDQEIQSLSHAVAVHRNTRRGALYLYGSRVDDSLKGGDIDLLLIGETLSDRDFFESNKIRILTEMKYGIGDRRIDLSIAARDDVDGHIFLSEIMSKAVLLESWS
jgi:hypothetical protein